MTNESLRLGNVSLTSRKLRTIILSLFVLLGIGNVWGALSSPYECVFTSGMSMSGSNCTTGDVTWTVSTTTGKGSPSITFGNQNSQSCIKFGSGKNNYYSKMTLTTSAFSAYNVSSVVIYASSNNGGSKTFKVTQGATQIGTGSQTFSSTTWVTNITRNTTAGSGGDLSIEISSDATATFVHSIKVTYSAASCTTKPTVGSSLTSVSATVNSITATVPISAIGGCNITENGLVYSTSNSTPTVGGTNCTKVTTTACGSTAANKTVTISDLTCGTTYYVRGYATNAAGTQYTTNTKTQSTSACPLYTVTLMDDGDTRTQASYGASVTLPSRAGCTGYTFAGWSTTNNTVWTTTAPTIISAGIYTPTANINLYPVYTKTESGSGFSSYTKVTSAPSDWSGKYLISDGTNTATGSQFSATALAITTLTPGTTEYTSYEFTITKNGNNNNYYIISPDGTYYVGYSGSSAGLAFSESTPNSNNYLWTCQTSDPMTLNVGTNTRYIGVGTESQTSVFKAYSTAGTNAKCYLYKRIEGGSTTYYISVPNCCTPLASINGSVKSSSKSPTGLTLQWDDISNVSSWAVTGYDNTASAAVSAGNIASPTDEGSKYECVVSNLTAGHSYTFTIAATAAANYCDKSDQVTTTMPLITLSETGLSGMSYIEGSGPSTQTKTFTVTAVGLTGNLTVSAPDNFQVSTDNSSWASSKTLTATDGAASGTVYVRLASDLSEGSYGSASTYVTVSGGSATTKNVSVQGTVSPACSDPTINTQPASSATYNMNATATALSVSATRNGTGPELTYQWYRNTANSKTTPTPAAIDGAMSASYTPPTTATGTKYYFCEVSSGACAVTTNISAITVNTPSITASETARAFGDREVNAGPYTMTFTVSGSNLAKDAPITISGASGMFSVDKTSVSQTSTGAVSTTTITVSYTPTTTGTHNATLTIASTGATSKMVALSGTARSAATVILHDANGASTITPDAPKTQWFSGDSYTLPTTATTCLEMGLYGWYTETYSHATVAPSGAKFVAKGGSKTLAAGENHFYAVYADIDEKDTYTQITTTGQLVTGEYLVAGLSCYCMSNEVNNSHMTEVAMNDDYDSETGVITNSSHSDIVWTITKDGSNYTFYNAAAGKYLALTTSSPVVQASPHNFTVALSGSCWVFSSTSVSGYKLSYDNLYFESKTTAGTDYDVLLYKRDITIENFTTSPSCEAHDLTVETDPAADAGGTAEAVKTTLGEGKTTTATATPDEHYTFSHWTISGNGSTMSNTVSGKSTDNPVTVTMGTEDATLTAHFTEKPKCTVEFYNNGGSAISSTTYWLGETPLAPTLTDGTSHDACDATSDKHYGWTKTKITTTIETQAEVDALTGDAVIYTKGITLPAVATGDDGTTIKYHAVWAKATGSSSYELITSLDDLKAGDAYLGSYINYSGWRYYGATSNSAMANVTVSGDPLALSSTTGLVRVTLVATANANEYQIKNSSNQYLYANSTGSAPSWSATACAWTFSNKDANNLFKVKSSLGTYYLRSYASSTTAGALKMYGTETNSGICVFQQGIVYSKFLTTCCDDFVTIGTPTVTGSGAVTFSIGGEAVAAGTDVETCTAGKTIVATVTPATGYSCTTLSFSRDDAVTLDIDVDPSSTKPSAPSYQDYTMTFEKGADITLSTSATFSPIPVSSLSLRVQQTGQSDKVGNDLTMSCYPKEGQSGGNDPLNHTLKVLFEEVLPANALDKAYDWSVRVKATGDAVWTAVGFTGNALNTNTIINSYNKSTGNLQIKATEGTAEIKITAHDGSGVNAKVTITVANVAMSSVSVSPTEMEVYAGQKKPVTVTFTPANATDRSYSAGSSYTYVNIQNKGASSFNIEGKTSVTDANHDETVTVTTTDGSKTATIDVTVKPLPKVMFVDNVHNESFANVIATVDDGGLTVTTTKSTPTHSDVSDPGASYNTCERQHLHLIGWILSTWADANPSAGNDAIKSAGAGKYYSAGADIDLEAQNGKTYYAVWTKIE